MQLSDEPWGLRPPSFARHALASPSDDAPAVAPRRANEKYPGHLARRPAGRRAAYLNRQYGVIASVGDRPFVRDSSKSKHRGRVRLRYRASCRWGSDRYLGMNGLRALDAPASPRRAVGALRRPCSSPSARSLSPFMLCRVPVRFFRCAGYYCLLTAVFKRQPKTAVRRPDRARLAVSLILGLRATRRRYLHEGGPDSASYLGGEGRGGDPPRTIGANARYMRPDNVCDNVGDCAGGRRPCSRPLLFRGRGDPARRPHLPRATRVALYPRLVIGGAAIIASIIGPYAVRCRVRATSSARCCQGLLVSGVASAGAFAADHLLAMRNPDFQVGVGDTSTTPELVCTCSCAL